MRNHFRTSKKKLVFAAGFLTLFTCMILFLFLYKRDEKRFANITSELFINEMKSNTLNMHYTLANPQNFGIYTYEPTLGGYRPDSAKYSRAALENTLASLYEIHTDKLSESDAYLWKLLTRSLENSLALNSFPYYGEPLSPSSGTQTQLPVLLAEYTFRCKRDVEDYLALLEQTDEYFASLLLYEQDKARAGFPMPAVSLKSVRKQCDTIVTSSDLASGTHFLQTTFQERLAPLCQSGEITEKEAQKYLAQNERLLNTVLLPAYTALGDGLLLLEDSSVKACGLGATPEGKSYYEALVISETGSYRSIAEIQELLTKSFSQEYDAIKSLVTQSPELLENYGKESPAAFPYRDASQMLLDLQTRMSNTFPTIPGDAVTAAVKPVSECLQDYTAPAFYLTAPLDDTDVNFIYINRSKTPDGLDLYTTLAHEGYPGHMYQTAYYNRTALARGERPVRELLWYGGYLEGWALYVESLSYDYASDLLREYNQEEAALSAQIEKHNRNLQLCLYSLLDIMIHYENASYSQIARSLENFGFTDEQSIRTVYTYIVQEPCNYLKYYLGYLELLSLQSKAKQLWKEEYSDLRFHTFYLDCGPSDFSSLEERLLSTP